MEEHPKVKPIPVVEFPATRPGVGIVAVAVAAVVALVLVYYWPVIRPHFGV